MNHTPDPTNKAFLPQDVAARMQAILERHAKAYRDDLPGLIEKICKHAETVGNPDLWKDAMPLLKREAHDMKGQAATFGLPQLSVVSQSLCRVLDRGNEDNPIYAETVTLHVSAIVRLANEEDAALVQAVQEKTSQLLLPRP